MERRTRLGKIVGSAPPSNPEGYVYWPEANWTTGEAGYITVAPSGARMHWFADEADALAYVAEQNRDWFAA